MIREGQVVATGAKAGTQVPDANRTERGCKCHVWAKHVWEVYTHRGPELLLQAQEASPTAWRRGKPYFHWGRVQRGFFLISVNRIPGNTFSQVLWMKQCHSPHPPIHVFKP